MPVFLGGLALLWTAPLLLLYPDGMSAGTREPTVSLNPPWTTILKEDRVTLTCKENNSLELNSTVWFHNKTKLRVTTLTLDIVKAQTRDSGEYTCQNKGSMLSKPVSLKVFSEWLLLQASTEVVLEGESFLIRCHSWRNLNVKRVTYYRNGKFLQFWYDNYNITINNATETDSGTYYCTGWISKKNHTSNFLNIVVRKDSPPEHQSKYYWLQFVIPSLVVLLFAADTGLFISTQQQLTLLLKIKTTRRSRNLMDPRPKPDPKKN
ncbi:high affinity immunoglobulin epsilon receptor subunit alpha [Prionailurus bengalensis]|uniref:high affinity immunoglobulin epsilon receptor subunit alpha n=1 Tax=Prionailurus bengalensis TaxID=37029 RepID=UPI001CA97D92|nr:high affinity immunoglobulin epsilon receptor subunit alpha [Prionailurus bengalensis]